MQKTILITGSTDGIGFETAKQLAALGHEVLLHGRNETKLEMALANIQAANPEAKLRGYIADLSDLNKVKELRENICGDYERLDVLINNAGIFKTDHPITADNLDIRFVVNTFAPVMLLEVLKQLMADGSRVINLSSAAQERVNLHALTGKQHLIQEFEAYAQSKLALTQWSHHEAQVLKDQSIMMVAVNPGSLLASKMVKEGFGVAGKDIQIGVDILLKASLDDEFNEAHGLYFNNDAGKFSDPHADVFDAEKTSAVVSAIRGIIRG